MRSTSLLWLAALALRFSAAAQVEECPAEPLRLKRPNPPVLDQGETPWCASFATASLLNYHLRGRDASLSDDFCISVMDLNSRIKDSARDNRNRFKLTEGGNITAILEDFQATAAPLKTDKGSPFLFTHRSGVDGFVGRQSAAARAFFEKNPNAIAVELTGVKDAIGVTKVDGSVHAVKGDDHVAVELPNESIRSTAITGPDRPESYPRQVKVPPFEIHESEFHAGSPDAPAALRSQVIRQLRADRPLALNTCQNALEKEFGNLTGDARATLDQQLAADPCGAHALTVVGVRRNGEGQCVAILQNSWGKNWNGNGLVEVGFDRLLSLVASDSRTGSPNMVLELTWLEDAKKTDAANTNEHRGIDGAVYRGQFLNDRRHGQGLLKNSVGEVFTGTFDRGRFRKGNVENLRLTSATYTGEAHTVDSGENKFSFELTGKGRLDRGGAEFHEGTFASGLLADGTRHNADGSTLTGQFRNGSIQDVIAKDFPFGGGRKYSGRLVGTGDSGITPEGDGALMELPDGGFQRGSFRKGTFTKGEVKNMDLTVGGIAGKFTGDVNDRKFVKGTFLGGDGSEWIAAPDGFRKK